ncbi:hypothetical protein [Absidia glauca]|uniref:Adhesin domain-containing protein n=1 Tax=Absidia glauca TaxID=4829 RepID=A0A168MYS6_ABSGL|nr:hypothetical protein [Absidia glauca]
MDTPPPYSEVDQSGSPRQSTRHAAESSGSRSTVRTMPSAPVLYNTTSDAKIAYNLPFGAPGMSYLSPPQSFSPPHLPPVLQVPHAPPMPPLKNVQVQPQWTTIPGPSRPFASSSASPSSSAPTAAAAGIPSPPIPPPTPPRQHQYGRYQDTNQSSYFAPSPSQQPRSAPHSPISPLSSSPLTTSPLNKQDMHYNEKQPKHQQRPSNKGSSSSLPSASSSSRRLSSSSLSSSSSSDGSTSSWKSKTESPKTCDKDPAPKFNNRKSSIEMKEVNKRLDWLQPRWYGKYFSLKTTNAMVDVHGSLDAKSVIMMTTNAKVNWRGDSILCKDMDLRTTNAAVDMVGDKVDVKQSLKIRTSNAQLIYDKPVLLTKDLSAVTTNSEIRMRHAHIKRSISCKTTNAPVNLYIQSIPIKPKSKSPPKINVEVSTTNAPVTIHMPSDFAGEFKLATSPSKAIIIEDRQNSVVYSQDKKESVREGYRSKKSYGSLKVTTTEGNITILFDQ